MRNIFFLRSFLRKSLTWYPDFHIYKVLRNGRASAGTVCRPPFRIFFQYRGESLSGSRQQQVVNPFFKGSAATVRFEVARVKRTPSGDLFVFFTLSLTAASFRPLTVLFPPKPRSRHEPANLCTFSNHAVSFPVPLLWEDPSTTTRVTRGKRISCHWKFVVRVYTSSFELVQRIRRNEFIRFFFRVFATADFSRRVKQQSYYQKKKKIYK